MQLSNLSPILDTTMSLRTYGDKPISFQVEENGEFFCIGSEVGNFLRLFRGSLYKKYPGMYRRTITNDERKKLIELGLLHSFTEYKLEIHLSSHILGLSQHVLASSVSLLKACEVEDIIEGNDEKYKAVSVHTSAEPPTPRFEFSSFEYSK